MFRDAALVAGKDLRVELRSRVTTQQVAPFALLVLCCSASPSTPTAGILERASSGLFWVAVLFCALLAIQRAFAIEAADGGRDALRLSGLDPAGHLPRQGGGGRRCSSPPSRWCSPSAWSCSTAPRSPAWPCCWPPAWPRPSGWPPPARCTACSPPVCASRDTLLPLLLLPVLAPVLIGATRAFDAALGARPSDGWPWCGLLAAFALAYLAVGTLAFGTLLEES